MRSLRRLDELDDVRQAIGAQERVRQAQPVRIVLRARRHVLLDALRCPGLIRQACRNARAHVAALARHRQLDSAFHETTAARQRVGRRRDPHAGEVGLAVGGLRCRRREIRCSIGGARYARRAMLHPLRIDRAGAQTAAATSSTAPARERQPALIAPPRAPERPALECRMDADSISTGPSPS